MPSRPQVEGAPLEEGGSLHGLGDRCWLQEQEGPAELTVNSALGTQQTSTGVSVVPAPQGALLLPTETEPGDGAPQTPPSAFVTSSERSELHSHFIHLWA